MSWKIITYKGWKRFWSKENTWLQSLFQSVKDKIDAIPAPDLSAVAKEANATANKEAIIQALSSTPFAHADGNKLTLHMVTLKMVERMYVGTSEGLVSFEVEEDEDNFYLNFSSSSPQEIAGMPIHDDAKVMYDEDYIFSKLHITFPAGWTINGVYLEGIEGNILEDGDAWRLADIQRTARRMQGSDDTATLTATQGYAQSAATDAAAAKTAAQGITGYALQGANTTATNTAIYQLIEQEGIPTANAYAAEIREIIGDWSQESES